MASTSGGVKSLGLKERIRAFYTGGICAVTKDGAVLVTPVGAAVALVETGTGKERSRLGEEGEGTSEVSCLALHPSEERLVVGHANLLLREWDLRSGTLLRSWRSAHRAPVVSLAFHPHTGRLASGGGDGLTRLWDLDGSQCSLSWAGRSGVVSALAFSPALPLLLIGTGEGEVRAASTDDPQGVQRTLLAPFGSAVTAFALHGSQIVAACRDGRIRCWSGPLAEPKVIEVSSDGIEWVTHPLSLPDFKPAEAVKGRKLKGPESLVLCGGSDGCLSVWDMGTRRLLHSQQLTQKGQGGLCQLLPAAEAQAYFAFTQDQNIVRLSGTDLAVEGQWVGYNDEVLAVCFLEDEAGRPESLVAATNSPQLRLYDLASLRCRLLGGHSDTVLSLASLRGRRFLSASKDNVVRLWDGERCLAKATGHTNNVTCVCPAPAKGRFLVSGSDDSTLKLWTLPAHLSQAEVVEEGAEAELSATDTAVAHPKGVVCVDVSPNDSVVASGSLDSAVKLWRVEKREASKGKRLAAAGTLKGHSRGIWDLKFSPSDQVLATASGDCTIKIFSLQDQSCVKTLEGHQCAVLSLVFLGRGLSLYSADGGGVGKLWSVRTGEAVKTEEAHEGKVWALAVSEGPGRGALVATGALDAELRLWEEDSEAVAAAEAEKRQLLAAQEQSLSNLLKAGRLAEALRLALSLERPHAALGVLRRLGDGKLSAVVKDLSEAEVGRLLEWSVEWNSRRATWEAGQWALSAVLATRSPQSLLGLPQLKELLQGLLPYTRRHYERLDRLSTASHFLRYAAEQATLL